MQRSTVISTLALVFVLTAGLSGCAIFPKCSPENCASDAKITADVESLLTEHREFGAPAGMHIQTINGVVYLNGTVDTEFAARNAEALVRGVANVKDVENNLNVRSNGR
jgi:osmotically-inducible protein OsmY